MRFQELDQPVVGDILEIEIGDQIVEAVIAEINGDEIISETDNVAGGNLLLEHMASSSKAVIKGMRELSGDQYVGLYKFGNDVAGHDGDKQTAPNGGSDDEVSDKPFAYAYTEVERKKIDGADPDNKQVTSDKSEEPEDLDEAEYQGRTVKLGKPMQGDVKKFKVYVRNPKTGKTVKVNFGDPNMRIKKSNPARRRSFRARHNCANPGPRTKARYWSCRKW
jgi:hypothetical protein